MIYYELKHSATGTSATLCHMQPLLQVSRLKLEDIAQDVCAALNITTIDLVGNSRKGCLPDARAIFARLANTAHYNKSEIARYLNNDHSTVICMLRRYDIYSKNDTLFKSRVKLVNLHLENLKK